MLPFRLFQNSWPRDRINWVVLGRVVIIKLHYCQCYPSCYIPLWVVLALREDCWMRQVDVLHFWFQYTSCFILCCKTYNMRSRHLGCYESQVSINVSRDTLNISLFVYILYVQQVHQVSHACVSRFAKTAWFRASAPRRAAIQAYALSRSI